jgi:hypothetical protein
VSDQDTDALVGADHPRVMELLNVSSVNAVWRRVREVGVPHIPMGRGKGRYQFSIPALKEWIREEAKKHSHATAGRKEMAQEASDCLEAAA